MKLSAILLVIFTLFAGKSYAQNGNEWIQSAQLYAKIKIGTDGWFRLTDSTLAAHNFPRNFNPKNLQLYHRGKEVAIKVVGENDGVFNATDYIEFYGQKNDGTLDQELYRQPDFQPNKLYNLFSDTTCYFLTVGTFQGRRISSYLDDSNSSDPESYHLAASTLIPTEDYASGAAYGDVILSQFDQGEGFTGARVIQNQSATYVVKNVNRAVTDAVKPRIELQITGRGPMNHVAEITVGPSFRLLDTKVVEGFQSVAISKEVEWTDFVNGEVSIRITVKTSNTTSARVSLNYVRATFPQKLEVANHNFGIFNLRPNITSESRVQLPNPATEITLYDITDSDNPVLISPLGSATFTAVVKNTGSTRKVIAVRKPLKPSMTIISFPEIQPGAIEYLILTHPILRKAAGKYPDPVQAYADYRSSVEGGDYQTTVLNIDDVYNSFSYGEQTPLAIYRLLRYINTVKNPSYFLIIGKGLEHNYGGYRNPASLGKYNLVPTGGEPGSDLVFSMGLSENPALPGVPTGRIPAMTASEVAAYLDKVIEKEALPFDDLRRKDVLHLSGGIYPGEAETFRYFLEQFAVTAEGLYLGGATKAVAKKSSDIRLVNIAEEVNDGVSLVTFFGHSSPNTLDFDVGYVSDPVMGYNNTGGRYPVLLMNGCDAGSFFLNTKLFGEDWITTPKKGAIGFIAHSAYGITSTLRKYSEHFYDVAFADSVYLAGGVGDVQIETARRHYLSSDQSPGHLAQIEQMIYLGDPAVKIFGAPLPDYAIDDEQVSIASLDGNAVSALSDSFAIRFVVKNFGQARSKNLKVHVIRYLNDRTTVSDDSVFAPVLYSDTLLFKVKRHEAKGIGTNSFEIRVDGPNEVAELSETNNTAFVEHFFALNGTKNIYPRQFAIVADAEVSFTFQHSNILSDERDFLFEVDTVKNFDSPFRKSYTVAATVLGLLTLPLLSEDSVVYYWRTKLKEPRDNESRDWTTSSFTYIAEGPSGWMQSEFSQYESNRFAGLVAENEGRQIRFHQEKTNVEITTFGMNASAKLSDVSVKINGAEFQLRSQGFGCRSNTLNLISFNKTTTAPYLGVNFTWMDRAGRTCGREPWVINSFQSQEMATGNGDDLVAYVNNVNVGDSVLLFTIGTLSYANWRSEVKSSLLDIGVSAGQLDLLIEGEPVVILARKGSPPGSARMIRTSADFASAHTVNASVTGGSGYGEMESVNIGPSRKWHRTFMATDTDDFDNVQVDVIGITKDRKSVVLRTNISSGADLDDVSAETYPYLRLVFKSGDEINLTPALLQHWIVSYDPAPEGLVFENQPEEQVAKKEGDLWQAAYGFVNTSDVLFKDSLVVNYTIYNHQSRRSIVRNIKINAPLPGDTTEFIISVNTFGLAGLNDLEVFVNPYVEIEEYYDNNFVMLPGKLFVVPEVSKPIIDVTVDGRYIARDEVVSSNPSIIADIWDENPFLLISDTTSVRVFFAGPCFDEACSYSRIYFTQPNVFWSPAQADTPFRVEFTPGPLTNGQYRLRVNATDKSGNSADNPFELSFRVDSDAATYIERPYPNPTTGISTFIVHASGTTPPDRIRFSLTSTDGAGLGNVEFSSLRVGPNFLQLNVREAFDVNPGIYIYTITVKSSGADFIQRGKIMVVK